MCRIKSYSVILTTGSTEESFQEDSCELQEAQLRNCTDYQCRTASQIQEWTGKRKALWEMHPGCRTRLSVLAAQFLDEVLQRRQLSAVDEIELLKESRISSRRVFQKPSHVLDVTDACVHALTCTKKMKCLKEVLR